MDRAKNYEILTGAVAEENNQLYPEMGFVPPRENPPPYTPSPPDTHGQGTSVTINQPIPQPTVLVTDPNQVKTPVGPQRQSMSCPSCRQTIMTKVVKKSGIRTHLIAFILCCTVICCPCMCIPYCLDSCRDRHHYCSNCHAYLGTYPDYSRYGIKRTYVVVN